MPPKFFGKLSQNQFVAITQQFFENVRQSKK